jgi:hypothetical protein
VKTNVESHDAILNLNKNDVIIINKPNLMRGLDYRSVEKEGIALLVAKKFSSKRTYKQALGRVGRFGEPCKRYKSKDVAEGFDTL